MTFEELQEFQEWALSFLLIEHVDKFRIHRVTLEKAKMEFSHKHQKIFEVSWNLRDLKEFANNDPPLEIDRDSTGYGENTHQHCYASGGGYFRQENRNGCFGYGSNSRPRSRSAGGVYGDSFVHGPGYGDGAGSGYGNSYGDGPGRLDGPGYGHGNGYGHGTAHRYE